MTKEARRCNGDKAISSMNDVGETGGYRQKSETGPLSYTAHKNKLKMGRPETIKCLEENQAVNSPGEGAKESQRLGGHSQHRLRS